MKRIVYSLFALFVACLGCGSGNNNNPVMNSGQGGLQVVLTDNAPGAAGIEGPVTPDEVWVNIGQIDARFGTEASWHTLTSNMQMINLISLTGVQSVIGSGNLPTGTYSGLRLFIASGYVVDNAGQQHDLKVPSGMIEVPVVFEVKQGQITKVLLDINGKESVHVVETNGKSPKWILRPVLSVIAVSNGQ